MRLINGDGRRRRLLLLSLTLETRNGSCRCHLIMLPTLLLLIVVRRIEQKLMLDGIKVIEILQRRMAIFSWKPLSVIIIIIVDIVFGCVEQTAIRNGRNSFGLVLDGKETDGRK